MRIGVPKSGAVEYTVVCWYESYHVALITGISRWGHNPVLPGQEFPISQYETLFFIRREMHYCALTVALTLAICVRRGTLFRGCDCAKYLWAQL